ncbi:MAG: helix-turn-helix domain-containing protein [Candidatus Hodarchaeota archaeon]
MATTRSTQQTPQSVQKPKARASAQRAQVAETLDTKRSIIELLKEKGTLTRSEITLLTGIPRTTVYDTLMNLLISGAIEKYVERNGRRGRPSVFYSLV